MNQEKNIYVELPEKIKEKVSNEAQIQTSLVMDEALTHNKPSEILQSLKQAYFRLLVSSKSSEWFKNEAHLKDLDMAQESYDKEIATLNEVIQRKAKSV